MRKYAIGALIGLGVVLSGCGSSESSNPVSNEDNTSETVDDGSFEFRGFTYNTVVSPYTNRIWLDRNLGASRVCEVKNDTECYGKYYQWGRLTDGHQEYNSQLQNTQADSVTNAGDKFINAENTATDSSGFSAMDDWAYKIDTYGNDRIYNWMRIDGDGVCPVGFRVPTYEELNAEFETVTSADSAYNKFLKLPAAGYRVHNTGIYSDLGTAGVIWSSTPTYGTFIEGSARSQYFTTTETGGSYSARSNGQSIRCIKD